MIDKILTKVKETVSNSTNKNSYKVSDLFHTSGSKFINEGTGSVVNNLNKKSVPNFDPNFYSTNRQLSNLSNGGSYVFSNPYEQSVWIYAANKKISSAVSQSPYLFYKEGKLGQKVFLPSDHELNVLFDAPNPMMSRQEIILATMTYMGLDGEAFWIIDRGDTDMRDVNSFPCNIWCFRKNYFNPIIDKKTGLIDHWEFSKNNIKLETENVIQFKYFNPEKHYEGLAPWKPASLSSEQDYYASNYNTNFFRQGAAIGGFLEVESELGDIQFERLMSQVEDRHEGHTKAHRLMLLEGGTKYKEAKLSQRDMEFIQTKKLTKAEILAAYGTNPVVLGDFNDVKSEAGVHAILKDFWTSVVIPNQDYIENKFYSEFLKYYDPTINMYFDNSSVEILQEDYDILLERGKKLMDLGYTTNQINIRLGLQMPHLDTGNENYRRSFYINIEDDLAEEEIVEADLVETQVVDNKTKTKAIDLSDRKQREYVKQQKKGEAKIKKDLTAYFNKQEKRVLSNLSDLPQLKGISDLKNKGIDDIWNDEEEVKLLIKTMTPNWLKLYELGFETVALDLESDILFDPTSPEFLKFLKFKVNKIAPSIYETVKRSVTKAVSSTIEEGGTIKEVAEAVKKAYDVVDSRAFSIARTESTSSLNSGRLDMYSDPVSGVDKIMWVTAQDENVRGNKENDRGNHVLLDGQTAKPGEEFVRSDGVITKLRYPGDNQAPAYEVVNCRCVIVEYFGEI